MTYWLPLALEVLFPATVWDMTVLLDSGLALPESQVHFPSVLASLPPSQVRPLLGSIALVMKLFSSALVLVAR